MRNKFKLKKKLISIALALALAAQPLASFPMNVFAGTDKNKLIMAPRIEKKTVSVPVPTTFSVPLTGTVFIDVTVPVDVTARVTDNSIDIEATAQPQPPAEPTA